MLNFLLVVFALLALAGGLYWLWLKKIATEVAEGAAYEWAFMQKHEPEFLAGISEELFRKIYARIHTPRFPGYALVATGTFFATMPLTLGLLSLGAWAAEKVGFLPEPVEIVRYVRLGGSKATESWQCDTTCQLQIAESFAGFYYFFGIIAVWLVIVWLFMRRFHARRPGLLRDEIIRART
jgi:hypothetical protein